MKSKKIIILGGSINDMTSPRVMRIIELTKEFIRQGNHVVLYGSNINFNTLTIESSSNLQIKNLGNKRWGKNQKKSIISKAINKILLYLFTYPDLELVFMVKKALKKEIGNKYDLLISIAVPHQIHWGCSTIINKKTKPELCNTWVADCGDPFTGNKTENFKYPFYFKLIEKWCFRKVNYITIPLVDAKKGYDNKFWSKIKIIPQGFNFDEIKVSSTPPNNNIPTFIYAGGFIKGIREPNSLLDFLDTLEIDFHFIVYTKCGGNKYFDNISKNLKKKITIKEYIPRIELIETMSQADFLINLENGTNIQSPSKLIDYALSGRPILSIYSNELDQTKIIKFLNGIYDDQLIIKNISSYNIKNVVRDFLKLC
ncbi:hypothetical protein LJC57_05700 [Parabacteroides sp. OttesenSCG-928-G07]|nr:hypothetical protein [Parabacteroides sp. OttesenSCG-928-G21]MDL2278068.1 hypothetical protein [Parabacteroides sp. OttesenSCG-928-G07]